MVTSPITRSLIMCTYLTVERSLLFFILIVAVSLFLLLWHDITYCKYNTYYDTIPYRYCTYHFESSTRSISLFHTHTHTHTHTPHTHTQHKHWTWWGAGATEGRGGSTDTALFFHWSFTTLSRKWPWAFNGIYPKANQAWTVCPCNVQNPTTSSIKCVFFYSFGTSKFCGNISTD